jgi:DNA-nicking Smr family endonuclease
VVPRGYRQGDPTPRLSPSARVHERDRDDLKAHNDDPKPFIWAASAENIFEKVRRGRVALDAITN